MPPKLIFIFRLGPFGMVNDVGEAGQAPIYAF